MTFRRCFAAALFSFAAVAACNDEVAIDTPSTRGAKLFRDPSLSANVYATYSCATCHATDPSDARRLPGASLDGVTSRPAFWGGTERDWLDSVNVCLTRFMLDPKGLARDDARASDLYAYLDSLPKTTPGRVPFTVVDAVADAPAGDATRGQNTYQQVCQTCHGDIHTGDGRLLVTATVLPEGTIAEHGPPLYTELELRETFVEKIRHGDFLGYAGQMPPFSLEKISNQEIGDVIAYFGVTGGVDTEPLVIETDTLNNGCPTVITDDSVWAPSTATFSGTATEAIYAFTSNMPGFSVTGSLHQGPTWTGRPGIYDVNCAAGDLCLTFSPDDVTFYDATMGAVSVDLLTEHDGVVDQPFSVAFGGVEVHARDGSAGCYYLDHVHFGERL